MSEDNGLIRPVEPLQPGYASTHGPRGRRIIQIVTGTRGGGDKDESWQGHILYALCSDGTMWAKTIYDDGESEWTQVEDVPAPTGFVRDGVHYPK